MALLQKVRCHICGCWFGTHDHAVLHGDGLTDDTFAIQAAFNGQPPLPGHKGRGTPGGPVGSGKTFRVTDSVRVSGQEEPTDGAASDPRPDPRTHPEYWTE